MPKKLITAALDPIIEGGLILYKNQIVRTNIQQFINFFSFSGARLNETRPSSLDQTQTPQDPTNGYKFIDFPNTCGNLTHPDRGQLVLLEKLSNGGQPNYALISIGSPTLFLSLAGEDVTFLGKKPKIIYAPSFETSHYNNKLLRGYYIFDDNSFEPVFIGLSVEIEGPRTNIIGAYINDHGPTEGSIFNALRIVPHVFLRADNTLEYYPRTITTYNNAPFQRKDFIDLKEYFRLYSPTLLRNSLVENQKSIPNSSFQVIDDTAIQGKILINLQQDDNNRGFALSNNGEVFSLSSSFTPARAGELKIYEDTHRPSLEPKAVSGSVTLNIVSYRENTPLNIFPLSLDSNSIPPRTDFGTRNPQEQILAAKRTSFSLVVSQANFIANNIQVPKEWGLTSQEVSEQISRQASLNSLNKADGKYYFTLVKETPTTQPSPDFNRVHNLYALTQDKVPVVQEIPFTKTITPTLPSVNQQSSLTDYSSISVTIPYSATVQQVEDLLNAAVGANTNTTIPKFRVCFNGGSVWRHPSDLTNRSLRIASSSIPHRRNELFFAPSSTNRAYEYPEYQNNGPVYRSGEWDYYALDGFVITRERLPQETEWVTKVSITDNTIEDPILFTTYTAAANYVSNDTVNRFAGGFRCCHTDKLDAEVFRVEYASNEDMLSAQKVFFQWKKINVYNNKAVSKIIIQKLLSPSFIFTDGSIYLPYEGLGFFPKSGLLAGKNVVDISCIDSGVNGVIALILCSDGSLFSVAGSGNVDYRMMGVSDRHIKITSGTIYPISFSHLKQTKIVKATTARASVFTNDNTPDNTRKDNACYAISETGDVFHWGPLYNKGIPSFFFIKTTTTSFSNVPSYSSSSLPNGLILNKDGALTGTATSVGDFIAKIKVSVEDFNVESSYDAPPITTVTQSTSDFIDIPIKVLPEPVSQQTIVDNNITNPVEGYIDPNQNSTGSSTNQVTLFSIPIDLALLNSRSKLIQLSFTMSRINTNTPKQQSYKISFGDIDVLDSLLTLSSSSSTLINLTVKINKISTSGLSIVSRFDYSDGTPPMTQSKSISLNGLVNQNIVLYATNEAGLSAPIISTKSGPTVIG